MTVPTYRAGTGSQPDPQPATARAAVDDLFRLHAVDLVRFALRLVGDQSTAEDVVQDAFLGLYRAWDRVRDPDAVLGYLRTAVVNGTRSVHRSRGRARLLRVQHDPPVWSAEAAVMDGEDRRAVLAAIATLPRRQREVLALKYYLDIVGAIIGNQVKQWSVPGKEAVVMDASVTSAGNKIAFIAQYNGPGNHFAAMALATSSAPGSLLTRATTVSSFDTKKDLYMFSAAISPDGTWVYVVTRPLLPTLNAKVATTLTRYSASRQGAPVTIATWKGGQPFLLPIGAKLFAWMYYLPTPPSAPISASTAYLINPATRTKTAVRLPEVPSGRYASLAW